MYIGNIPVCEIHMKISRKFQVNLVLHEIHMQQFFLCTGMNIMYMYFKKS